MKESEKPTDFYNDFESMSHMVDTVDALAEKDKTVEFVKSKQEFEFKKEHGESENSKSNAFTFEKRKRAKGHIMYVAAQGT